MSAWAEVLGSPCASRHALTTEDPKLPLLMSKVTVRCLPVRWKCKAAAVRVELAETAIERIALDCETLRINYGDSMADVLRKYG